MKTQLNHTFCTLTALLYTASAPMSMCFCSLNGIYQKVYFSHRIWKNCLLLGENNKQFYGSRFALSNSGESKKSTRLMSSPWHNSCRTRRLRALLRQRMILDIVPLVTPERVNNWYCVIFRSASSSDSLWLAASFSFMWYATHNCLYLSASSSILKSCSCSAALFEVRNS